jgi:hypothetical protein
MSAIAMTSNIPDKRKPAPLAYFLGTKRANPVFLDEHGKPVTSSTSHDHAGH